MRTRDAVAIIAAIFFATWLLGYYFAWQATAEPGATARGAFRQWLIDFLMLGWVLQGGTLIAGLLAFAAGAFVYLTARMQHRERESAAREARYHQTYSALIALETTLYRAHLALSLSPEDARACLGIGSEVRAAANSMPPGNLGVQAKFHSMTLAIDRAILAAAALQAPLDRRGGSKVVREGACYAYHGANLAASLQETVDDSGVVRARLPIPGRQDREKMLAKFDIESSKLQLLAGVYDWDV